MSCFKIFIPIFLSYLNVIHCNLTNETFNMNYLETTNELNISTLLDRNTTILIENYTQLTKIVDITKAISTKYFTTTNYMSSSTTASIKDLFKTNDEIFYQIYLKLLLNLNNRNEFLVSYISSNKTVLF